MSVLFCPPWLSLQSALVSLRDSRVMAFRAANHADVDGDSDDQGCDGSKINKE